MTYLALAPDVSFCLVGGDPVFLDLARDKYLRLGGESARAIHRLASGEGEEILDPGSRDRLVATRLFVASAEPAPIRSVEAPMARTSLIEDRTERAAPGWLLLPEALGGLLTVKRALARGRLRHAVDKHRNAKRRAGDVAELERIISDVEAYLALRPLLPVQPSCLPDSLALARFLRRRGAYPDLVFGVKLAPFGAHCWLQLEGTVLNDSLGNVCDFTPILVA